jgi:hypothetical protein
MRAAGLACLLGGMTWLSVAHAHDEVATPGAPGVVQLGPAPPVPPGARLKLTVALRQLDLPLSGAPVLIVIRLRPPDPRAAIEIGRWSIYPMQSFSATSDAAEQRIAIDAGPAASTVGISWSAELDLEPIAAGEAIAGARAVFSSAHWIVAR